MVVELDTAEVLALAEQDLEDEITPDLSHAEDISGWTALVQQQLQESSSAIRLVDLHQTLELSWVELLLAVLLGGCELEQRGPFYQRETIWVMTFRQEAG